MKCASCFHEEENHKTSICNADLMCLCQEFVRPILVEFAQKIEENKKILKTFYDRCKFILEKIPQSRNAGSKSFYKIYLYVWHGIAVRKDTKLDYSTWKRMPVSSSVNRSKRFVKQDHEELRTYKHEMLMEQTALYQAIVEMAIER